MENLVSNPSLETNEDREWLRLTKFTLDNAAEMVIWVNLNGEILYANHAFCDITGYNVEEILQLDVTSLYVQPNIEERRMAIWERLRLEKVIEIEADLLCKNGDVVPTNCQLNHIDFKGRELNCVFLKDLRKEKARIRQLRLFEKTVETAYDMICWLDQDRRIRFANQSFFRTLGYSTQQVEKMRFESICPDAQLPVRERGAGKAGAVQAGQRETFKKHNGEEMLVEFNLSRIAVNKDHYWCIIARDITEQQRREEEITRAKKNLEQLSLRLKDENALLQDEISVQHNFNNIISKSRNYRKVLDQAIKVAGTTTTVLLLGETGTGKELLARAIHSLSNRSDRPLVKINCAALPENLIESELFGHEKGAFTGAVKQKKGRFELADGGSLFLDEIGELPLELQPKLLRVLQEGEFERIGGNRTLNSDVRVIAATNRNLEQMMADGAFRQDLYYRLNVFPIVNLPLRERVEDIEVLVRHFAEKYSVQQGKRINRIPKGDLERLKAYDFPGNIRELENIVERAVVLTTGDVLNLEASFSFHEPSESLNGKASATDTWRSFEDMQRDYILKALGETDWRVSGPAGAARLLDLNPRTLFSKMRRLGLNREDYC